MNSEKHPILQNNFETESKAPPHNAQNPPSKRSVEPSVEASTSALPEEEPSGVIVGAHGDAPKKKRGPNTPEGKKAVSRNAVKHGIYSPHPVVLEDVESIEAWDEFRAGIIESWAPVGAYELELVEDIAWGQWRLRRCRIHETFLLNNQVEATEEELQQADAWEDDLPEGAPLPRIEADRLLFHQQLKKIPDDRSVDRVLRYETHVRRALQQAVQELEVRQAHRDGKLTPLARVAFSSGPVLRVPGSRGTARFTAVKQLNQDLNEIDRAIGERHTARLKIAENVRREAQDLLEREP